MDGPSVNLKLFVAENPFPAPGDASLNPVTPWPRSVPIHSTPDPNVLANRELIRPLGYRRAVPGLVAFSAAWYEELEQKRYQRHGVWLPGALEFGRHPGESLLFLGPGTGSDVVQYVRTGTPVTVGVTPRDYPDQLRENLTRHGLSTPVVEIGNPTLPFPDGAFDVVTWNALHDPAPPDLMRVKELFRVLKAGGKVIGLFPAWYDAGFWQDLLLPLQWLYWRRPVDPTTGPKTTARQLRRLFAGFTQHRVLVLKAIKPLPARIAPVLTGSLTPLDGLVRRAANEQLKKFAVQDWEIRDR